jgi:hypothetical protein
MGLPIGDGLRCVDFDERVAPVLPPARRPGTLTVIPIAAAHRFLQIQSVEVPERSKEDLLRHVARVIPRAQKPCGHGHDAGLVSQDDLLKGRRIAPERQANKPGDFLSFRGPLVLREA